LFLKNCAGGVHDQLWQKSAVEEMGEIANDLLLAKMWQQPPSAVRRAKLDASAFTARNVD
jgi:hypothetical protein